jgi:hypothetical protein
MEVKDEKAKKIRMDYDEDIVRYHEGCKCSLNALMLT